MSWLSKALKQTDSAFGSPTKMMGNALQQSILQGGMMGGNKGGEIPPMGISWKNEKPSFKSRLLGGGS